MSVHAAKRRHNADSADNLWVRMLSISAIGVVCMAAILFLSAYLILKKDLSGAVLPICAYCGCGIPALLCGFLCARHVPRHKAAFGILSAVPILLASLILCLCFYKTVGSGFGINCAVILCAAAAGAVIAVRKRSKKRKYKK